MNLTLIDEEINSYDFIVESDNELILNIAAFSVINETQINVIVKDNASFRGAFADFSTGETKFNLNVQLVGNASKCVWKSSSLSKEKDNKIISASVYHKALNTEALVSNYGIAMGKSRLIFTGVSQIEKGSKKAKTRQEAKIMVFDPECTGRCSPILNIDENDVVASHAAIVGKLSDNHLFYLESRGINERDAKRLITLGYLKPIEDYFDDEELKNRIDDAIEKGI